MGLANEIARLIEQALDSFRFPASQIDGQLGSGALPPTGNTGGGYTPAVHASTHESGGSDALALGSIAGTLTDAQHGSRSGGSLHSAATTGASGFMSAADKAKEDAYPGVSGLTTGHVLTAMSATAIAFQAPAFTDPMTTQDDLIVGGASGAPARLAKGTDGQVLTVDPTTHHLVWATPSGGGASLTVEEVDGSPTDSAVTKIVFPNGTLGIASHVATYTPASSGYTDPLTTRGDLVVRDASSTTRLAVGTSGKVLTSDGTDAAWGNGPLTTRGDIITGGVSGAIQRLALGTSTYVLTSDGTDAVWSAASSGGFTQGAHVYRDSNLTITTAVETTIGFNQERWDTDTIHDNSTNNERLTCKTAGKYMAWANIRFASSATSWRVLAIYVNATTRVAQLAINAVNGISTDMQISAVMNLAVNDYLTITANQNSGGNLDIQYASSVQFTTEFCMQRIA